MLYKPGDQEGKGRAEDRQQQRGWRAALAVRVLPIRYKDNHRGRLSSKAFSLRGNA